jgi:hypothetical protein
MDWQQAAALAIVAASFLWLLRRTFFARGKKGACGGCGSCSHAVPSAPAPQLVQLDPPHEPPGERLTAPDGAERMRSAR